MEAFYVVVLAVTVLGVGALALFGVRRMRSTMDPTDTPTDSRES
jgi:hypothetical protein